MRIVPTMLLACLALLAGVAVAAPTVPAAGRTTAPETLPFELAVAEAPQSTTLPEILDGTARVGFVPLLTPGTAFEARPGRALWLRVRTTLPDRDDPRWRLEIGRVPLEVLRLRLAPDGRIAARDGFFTRPRANEPWPSTFALPLPDELAGPVEFYVEMEGNVSGGLHVRLVDAARHARDEERGRDYFRLVYAVLLLVSALSLVRHMDEPRSGALVVGAAAFTAWIAFMALNGHLYSLPEVARLSRFGATVPPALSLLAAGPLLLATMRFAALDRSWPAAHPWLRGLGWLLVAAAVAAFVVPAGDEVPLMQRLVLVAYGIAGVACVVVLLLDPRNTRWAPLLCLLVAAVLAGVRLAADRQLVPANLLYLYGWQAFLALALLLYLLLPWIRSRLQRWAKNRRREAPEPTAEEKIALARETLMASLQSGLKNAADGDMKWIAFRRLLDGLKPVLPQTSAAVVAMHYHGEDVLQVQPRDAEARYRELLGQRTSLLKNLSRLRAPQQVGIDFDGPEGPLDQVQLAIIPLPVARPGWGALLVERDADVTYSDAELALCAEFAAMAVLAGDEAANALSAQRTADTDPLTGALRHDPLLAQLSVLMDAARQKQKPLCLLSVQVDQLPKLREDGGQVGAAAGLKPVAELLREEMDYGDVIGRDDGDGFLLVSQGRRLVEARDYADRLRAAVSRMPVDPRVAAHLTVSIGVAQAGPDERDPKTLRERAARVAQIALKNGGNQIFS